MMVLLFFVFSYLVITLMCKWLMVLFLEYMIVQVFKECHLSDASGNSFEFSLVGSKCIGAYELNKKIHNQVPCLLQLFFQYISFSFLVYYCKLQTVECYSCLFSLQIWWIWKKVNSKDDMGSQPFLDNVMYKNNAILLIQRIFGLGFMGIGGIGMQL